MINSGKLTKLKEDLEGQKTFFEYKADRFNSIIEKELNVKLVSKVDSYIVVKFDMTNKHNGFLPKILFKIGDAKLTLDSIYRISNCDSIVNSANIDSLGKVILAGFLGYEIKENGNTFKKIDKYMDILTEISHKTSNINNNIEKEKLMLIDEHNKRRMEVLEEFVKEGSEFVVYGYVRIAGKLFLDRNEGGVLIKIKDKEKRRFNIEVTGRKRIRRSRWDWKDTTYEYKLGVSSLIKLFKENLIQGSNPEFERALKIHCLMHEY